MIITGWILRPKRLDSQFRRREYENKEPPAQPRSKKGSNPMADSRLPKKAPTLSLEGFRESTDPFEILGVPRASDEETIQNAYRDLMKRYHPDKMGRPGTREWADAQKIAEQIN
jgi:DnaJ-domain-containing protein 1